MLVCFGLEITDAPLFNLHLVVLEEVEQGIFIDLSIFSTLIPVATDVRPPKTDPRRCATAIDLSPAAFL